MTTCVIFCRTSLMPTGPGSRASVMKDPNTQTSRRAKRATGVFYTPSDVAEYIVRETLGEFGQVTDYPRVLDPACGSGVFLKAVLDSAIARTPSLNRSDFVERCLHGIDVNPLAVEAACFVLLHECLHSNHRRHIVSPWSLWHRIRCNLCVADALTFLVAKKPTQAGTAALTGLRQRLNDSYVPPSTERRDTQATTIPFSESHSLGSVFPAISSGADIVIGNPPYARIGSRDDLAALERRFASLSAGCQGPSRLLSTVRRDDVAVCPAKSQFIRDGRAAFSRLQQEVSTKRRAASYCRQRRAVAFRVLRPRAARNSSVKT